MNSTRPFMRELNRLGLASVIDTGGGSQNYFTDRYDKQAVRRTQPVRRMLELDLPVGASLDATRPVSITIVVLRSNGC